MGGYVLLARSGYVVLHALGLAYCYRYSCNQFRSMQLVFSFDRTPVRAVEISSWPIHCTPNRTPVRAVDTNGWSQHHIVRYDERACSG